MSDDDDDDGLFDELDDGERKHLFERAVPLVFRRALERAIESGVRNLSEAPENLRDIVNELKLPKEAAHYVYEQVDDTKKGVYRVVAKEIRDVLEHINFADEIADVLTKLQFEINTTIRFVPNEDADPEARRGEDDKREAEPREGKEGDEPPEGEGNTSKRPSRIPRPRVVSKVVMKARDALERK